MRKWLKRIALVFIIPTILFGFLVIALYIPSLQNYLKREITALASEAIGMQIDLGRIDLRYPFNLLLSDLVIKEGIDSLFIMQSLNLQVKLLPLLRGRIDLNELTLRNISVNTQSKIEGFRVQGNLDYFFLKSHGIDLKNEKAVVNMLRVKDADLNICIVDSKTSPPEITETTPIHWQALLKQSQLENINIGFSMPLDTVDISTSIADLQILGANIDLGKDVYALKKLELNETSLNYQKGMITKSSMFNPSNLSFNQVHIAVDSLYNRGKEIQGILKDLSMREQSGLHITSVQGRFQSDSVSAHVPEFMLQTENSNLRVSFSCLWDFLDNPQKGNFDATIKASLGREDLFIVASELPDKFIEEYPKEPLELSLSIGGNLKKIEINPVQVFWPRTVFINGKGEIKELLDEVQRSGSIEVRTQLGDLNFLTSLVQPDSISSLFIPYDISLFTGWKMKGSEHSIQLQMKEDKGVIELTGSFNDKTEEYEAYLSVDSIQIQHFLPVDSLREFEAVMEIQGQGVDFQSAQFNGQLKLTINELMYESIRLAKIDLDANWGDALLNISINANNDLVQMNAMGQYHLASATPLAELKLQIDRLNLLGLGLIEEELRSPFTAFGSVRLNEDKMSAHIESGDFIFDFNAPYSVLDFTNQLELFTEELTQQVDDNYRIKPLTLKTLLPTVYLNMASKSENPIADFLHTKNIDYQNLNVRLTLDSLKGVQSNTTINQITINNNKIDTLLLCLNQDEGIINLRAGLINRASKLGFRSFLLGKIGENGSEVKLYYENEVGEKGLDFGIHVEPQDSGFYFSLIPDNPIIAFKNFQYENNKAYLSSNMKLTALIDLFDQEGIGFQLHSQVIDSIEQQSLNLEIQHIELAEIVRVVPFLPDISGLFSIEAHTIEVENSTLISAEVSIDELHYEKNRVGDLAWGITWMPDEKESHYLDSYLHHDEEEVLIADGRVILVGNKEEMEFRTIFQHFPLLVLNAFVPDGMLNFRGDIDGELAITGDFDSPQVNGEVVLDSVSVFSQQWGVYFQFDDRPLTITKNKLEFNQFSIYTTEDNPFTIDGDLSFIDLSNPILNVLLKADDYVLLNAKRRKESLAYGKVVVDVNTTVKGPIDALVMRGGMRLNGNTDVTYVLKDSPLTVQDRLGDLVTFTSFSDTSHVEPEDSVFRSLGGMDLLLNVAIDPAVRLKVDLSEDRSSRVSLKGGGDLTLQYTPQGDMNLSGRYTLTGGLVRYSLPVIPLKDFEITESSYVEWTGDLMNPKLNIKATERLRASVADENNQSRRVNFDLSILIKNRIDDLDLKFDIEAPEDGEVQKQLAAMSEEERIRQAVIMMATGRFMASDGSTGGGLDMGTALNSVLQSQINAVAGKMENVSFSMGVEEYDETAAGGKHTDYSFSYSQRFFNNRVQVVIGGKVSTGESVSNDMESFIDNISIEYRLDNTGTRYVRLFHNKNYDNILEGEVIETGVGLILRRKVDRLGELFIFKKRKKDKVKQKDEL